MQVFQDAHDSGVIDGYRKGERAIRGGGFLGCPAPPGPVPLPPRRRGLSGRKAVGKARGLSRPLAPLAGDPA
jgi:hypothetical protein